jgi:hypothetical protein
VQTSCSPSSESEKERQIDHLEALKTRLVDSGYVTHEVREQALELGRKPRTGPQEESCTQLLEGDVRQWLSSPARSDDGTKAGRNQVGSSQLMFVYSEGTHDASVSFIATSVLESALRDGKTVLHSASYYLDYTDSHHNGNGNGSSSKLVSRSPQTIAKEAIYQLIESRPSMLQNREIREWIGSLTEQSGLPDGMSCLKGLLLQVTGRTAKLARESSDEVIWVIDRIDLCSLGGRNARLSAFVQELQELIVDCHGKLRILLVSTHEPSALDKQWDPVDMHEVRPDDDDDRTIVRKRTWHQTTYRVRARKGS